MAQFSGKTGQMGSRRLSLPRGAFLQMGKLTPEPGRGFLRLEVNMVGDVPWTLGGEE